MANLFVINGPYKGRAYTFTSNPAFVGRLPDNDIQIRDKTISRKHLRIQSYGGNFVIRDLNSKNGTFINGRIVHPGVDVRVEEGVPITIGNISISLGINSSEEIFPGHEMETLAEEFSSTATYRIYKSRPLSQPKNFDFIYKVSNVLNQSLDINEIMRKMLDYIFDLLTRIDRGVIILLDIETGEFSSIITKTTDAAEMDDSAAHPSGNPLYSRTVVNAVINNRKPVTILDSPEHDESDISNSIKLMKVKSVMCVPLISKSKVRGVIYVDSLRIPYGFREEDIALLTSLCSPAGIAIENATLYSNMERLVDERTERLKKVEVRLKENQKRYRAMFNNMSSGVIVCKSVNNGDDFIILDVNKAECRIDKVVRKLILNKSLTDTFPEFRETGLLDAFRRVFHTNKPEHVSIAFTNDERSPSWREYYIDTLPDDEIMAIFDDVTEKILAELEQKALQEQLFASQKMESIGAFAGGTAHNFRNILQAITGNMEYLELICNENPEIKELTKSIFNSIDKGVGLINSLLQFAKKGQKIDMEDIDLYDVIDKTYGIIKRVFNKNIIITIDADKGLWVKGNASLLSQVFMNLFTNARDAMPKGGELIIRAKENRNMITATVSDTGYGIEQEVIDRIFDPFFTLKEVGAGTGLGLSTTLGIIEEHQGTISVRSKPDKGTTFTISLPFTENEIIPDRKIQESVIFGHKEKILIVDDEVSVLNSIAGVVRQMGYIAIPISDSNMAIENFINHRPDLVLIDRNMPGVDGIHCIREFIKINPDAKIIIISGYEDSGADVIDEDVRGMIKGYLVKPCGTIELSHVIADVLGIRR